jgi:hypothetical protein
MHTLEPHYRWQQYYVAAHDKRSPFYGREYSLTHFTDHIYGYYIHPQWDHIGSETLYVKVLFADYTRQVAIIEMLGEWNDTLHNDVMWLKRELVDPMLSEGIRKFILIGENVLNFHGSDDCYYEEWFEEVEDGWIAALNFRPFVLQEWKQYRIDWYINFGGSLDIEHWRTLKPLALMALVEEAVTRRLGA